MPLYTDPYLTERRLHEITPATTGTPRTYHYEEATPGRTVENRRDAETKTALSRLALGQLRIEAKLDELITEIRVHEPRTAYPHEPTEEDYFT